MIQGNNGGIHCVFDINGGKCYLVFALQLQLRIKKNVNVANLLFSIYIYISISRRIPTVFHCIWKITLIL